MKGSTKILKKIGILIVAASLLNAQPAASTHSTVPILLVDGYDALNSCKTLQNPNEVFGNLGRLLTRDGTRVGFFDNCTYPNTSIPFLAGAFGRSLAATFGTQPVDVVAYSMGGLIVRAYLANLHSLQLGNRTDPQIPYVNIRKLILIGTPNSGSELARLAGGQGFEMRPNDPIFSVLNHSHDLETVDVISIAGLGSFTGDGVVALRSAALNNVLPDHFLPAEGNLRTRVIPYCHTAQIPCGGYGGIAYVTGMDHPTYQIIRSFLDDTLQWLQIGLSPTQALAARQNGH